MIFFYILIIFIFIFNINIRFNFLEKKFSLFLCYLVRVISSLILFKIKLFLISKGTNNCHVTL